MDDLGLAAGEGDEQAGAGGTEVEGFHGLAFEKEAAESGSTGLRRLLVIVLT